MVTAKEGWMDLALKPDTYSRLVKTGLKGPFRDKAVARLKEGLKKEK